jgi:hypothetical protein
MATTFSDVQTQFHSMPQTKYEIPEGLENEWLKIAVADYELNLGVTLGYDEETKTFASTLSGIACRTLAQMMYVSYLQRELSRVMALNGIYGKDIQITGQDATKRVTKQELDSQVERVEALLHRQKQHAYG